MRRHANLAAGSVRRRVFYGASQRRAHRAAYDKAVQITTPLTAGHDGSIYFGFTVTGATPAHLSSGIARIDAPWPRDVDHRRRGRRQLCHDAVAMNCAPALSPSGATVYITVTSPTRAILVGLDAATLKPRFHVVLKDPVSGQPAFISTSSSASPTVGPDGDVYYGVLENPFPNHDDRGWLLHYDATLTRAKTPGSFGWDNTVSVLPCPRRAPLPRNLAVPPGVQVQQLPRHRAARRRSQPGRRARPRTSQKDPYTDTRVMKAVQTVLSPVHEPGTPAGARYEWCINSAVVDPADDSVIVNSKDGPVYRWDLARNVLAENVHLNAPRPRGLHPHPHRP